MWPWMVVVGSRRGPACRPPAEQSSWWCTGREDLGKRLATSLPAVLADHRPLQATLRVLARIRWQCGPLSPQPSACLVWGVSLACGPASHGRVLLGFLSWGQSFLVQVASPLSVPACRPSYVPGWWEHWAAHFSWHCHLD